MSKFGSKSRVVLVHECLSMFVPYVVVLVFSGCARGLCLPLQEGRVILERALITESDGFDDSQ